MRAARPWQGGSSRPRASLQVLAGLGAPWGMYLRALTINTHAGRCQGASLVAQLVKSLPAAQGARAPSLGPEDPPRAKWQPLQDSWLQNPADRGARRAAGHGVAGVGPEARPERGSRRRQRLRKRSGPRSLPPLGRRGLPVRAGLRGGHSPDCPRRADEHAPASEGRRRLGWNFLSNLSKDLQGTRLRFGHESLST